MKKIFVLVIILTITNLLQAQDKESNIGKGTWMLGGDLSFTSSRQNFTLSNGATSSNDRDSYINLSPQTGYFIANQFAITLGASYTKTPGSNSFLILPGIRTYVVKYLFLDAQVGFGRQKFEDFIIIPDAKQTLFRWEAGVGYSAFLGKKIALEPRLLYQATKQTFKGDIPPQVILATESSTNNIIISIGFKVFL